MCRRGEYGEEEKNGKLWRPFRAELIAEGRRAREPRAACECRASGSGRRARCVSDEARDGRSARVIQLRRRASARTNREDEDEDEGGRLSSPSLSSQNTWTRRRRRMRKRERSRLGTRDTVGALYYAYYDYRPSTVGRRLRVTRRGGQRARAGHPIRSSRRRRRRRDARASRAVLYS